MRAGPAIRWNERSTPTTPAVAASDCLQVLRPEQLFWDSLLTSVLTTLHNALSEDRSDASEIAAGPHRHIDTVIQECRRRFEVLAQVARCEFQNCHHWVTGLTSSNELP